MKIAINGIELAGCTDILRRFQRPKWSASAGGQSHVVRVRQHDIGTLTAYFSPGSPGQKHLEALSSDDTHELTVEGDSSGPDFTSPCWIDLDRSHGTTWLFDSVRLPR
jgi:hypothetical protein